MRRGDHIGHAVVADAGALPVLHMAGMAFALGEVAGEIVYPAYGAEADKAGAAKLRDLTAKAGRNPSAVGLTYRVSSNPEAQPKGTVDGERKLFTGNAADFAGDIRALADVGVSSFDFGLFGTTLAATIDNMRRFRDDVVAKVK